MGRGSVKPLLGTAVNCQFPVILAGVVGGVVEFYEIEPQPAKPPAVITRKTISAARQLPPAARVCKVMFVPARIFVVRGNSHPIGRS
jgi:hypothetical protein